MKACVDRFSLHVFIIIGKGCVKVMKFLPDARQMKEADRYTIQELGIPSLELMERAAASCVRIMEAEGLDLSDVCIVCGSGNNGGDGFAVARMLLAKGKKVEVVFAGKKEKCTLDTARQMASFENAGGTFRNTYREKEYTVVVDALFGVGLNREIGGNYLELIEKMNRGRALKVAVDIPSGVCAATGKILGAAFRADITITFQNEKLGLVLYPGQSYAGEIFPADIGIDNRKMEEDLKVAFALEPGDLKRYLPKREPDSHKGSYGRALIIAGSRGMAGAAYLSARAAYMAGAGLVRLYTVEENRVILQQLLPEAVLTTYEEFNEDELLSLLDWADVVGVGPGLGKSQTAREILFAVLKNVKRPCVIDADGLNLLAEQMELLDGYAGGSLIFTPHIKEMSRLTGRTAEELKQDRVRFLAEFTEKYPVTCVLKDARTCIGRKKRHMFVNLSGNAAMAKAGSGDVLTGIITGLLAQGMEPYLGAVLGVYIHGLSGDSAKKEKGGYSVLARDLVKHIGNVLKEAEKYS